MAVTQAECQRELVFRFSRISFEFSLASFGAFTSACLKSLAGRLYTFIVLHGIPFDLVYTTLFRLCTYLIFLGAFCDLPFHFFFFVFPFIISFAFVIVDFAYCTYFNRDSAFDQFIKLQLCTDPPKNVTTSSKLTDCW